MCIYILVAAKLQWKCDFEEGGQPDTCELHQDAHDDFDWLVIQGETPSMHTGPTMAYNGTYYAYIEASGKAKGAKAV